MKDNNTSYKQAFYSKLQDCYLGVKVKDFHNTNKAKSGFSNLLKIKAQYFNHIKAYLDSHIATEPQSHDIYNKLYTFFDSYLNESGTPFFTDTPIYKNIYAKVYGNAKDTSLFYKTQNLYYVKSDILYQSLIVSNEKESYEVAFDASAYKQNADNTKNTISFKCFSITQNENKPQILIKVSNQKDLFPELNAVFKQNSSEFSDEFLKALKHNEILKNARIKIDEDELKKIFRSYKKQSEIDFFIHKNAKAFLQDQFDLWMFSYLYKDSDIQIWNAEIIAHLQKIKNIAYEVINLIAAFENELKAVWLKPKFAKKVEYVFSLDRLNPLLDSIINDKGFESQIKEWQELGLIDEGFNKEELLHSLFKHKETQRDVSPSQAQHDNTICHFEQCEKSHVSLQKSEISNKNMDCHDSLWESRNDKEDSTPFRHCKHCEAIHNIESKTDCHEVVSTSRNDKEANPSLRKSETTEAIHNNKLDSHDFDKSNSHNDKEDSTNKDFERYRYLPLDTKHFEPETKYKILNSFENLESLLNGELIKSDNFQALNTLMPKYQNTVDLIYIDPPYNTGNDGFIYADNFNHTSWLSLMNNRLELAKELLNNKGSIFISIDDNEQARLKILCDSVFGEENFVSNVIWLKGNAQNDADTIQRNQEYMLCYAKNIESKPIRQVLQQEKVKVFKDSKTGRFYYEGAGLTTGGAGGTLNARPNLGFSIYYNPKTQDFFAKDDYDKDLAKISNDEQEVYISDSSFLEAGYEIIRPPKKGVGLGCWTWALDKFNSNKNSVLIRKNTNGYIVLKKEWLDSKKVKQGENGDFYAMIEKENPPKSFIDFVGSGVGTKELKEIFNDKLFNNPKPEKLLKRILEIASNPPCHSEGKKSHSSLRGEAEAIHNKNIDCHDSLRESRNDKNDHKKDTQHDNYNTGGGGNYA